MRWTPYLLITAGLTLAGCAPVAGTWKLDDQRADVPVQIAAMTLAEDGTFTAHALYADGQSEVMSGTYDYTDDTLVFNTDGRVRSYPVVVSDDEMAITHEGTTVRLHRLAK